jgi:hypothetical protein
MRSRAVCQESALFDPRRLRRPIARLGSRSSLSGAQPLASAQDRNSGPVDITGRPLPALVMAVNQAIPN